MGALTLKSTTGGPYLLWRHCLNRTAIWADNRRTLPHVPPAAFIGSRRRFFPRCNRPSPPAAPKSVFFFVNPSAQRGRTNGRLGPWSVAIGQGGWERRGRVGRHFPHRWRHSYATAVLRHGADIHVSSDFLATPTSPPRRVRAPLRHRPGPSREQGVPRRVSYSPSRISR